ncbi:MAG: Ppx/GppA phosphatase family protein [Armatimonadota bacterium]
MTAAAIDLGTNSIKMVVGTTGPNGQVRFLSDTSVITRLGEDVDSSGRIFAHRLQRSVEAVRELLTAAHEFQADKIRMVGTSALRDAANRDDVIRRFKDDLGVELEVLSEQDECRLSYLAVASDPVLGKHDGMQVTFDIGGGSTEFALGSGREIHWARSVNVGAVRLTERFLKSDPPTDSEMRAAASCVDEFVMDAAKDIRCDRAVGIGGSVINLARVLRGIPADRTEDVHGTVMSLSDVENLRYRMVSLPLAERKGLIGLDPERADIIVAGAIIVERVLKALGVEATQVSIRGLRHGVIREML